jgi:hypothetical protein
VQIKKPLEVSAPKYVEYLMDWIEGQLDDESIFPQKLGRVYALHSYEHVDSAVASVNQTIFFSMLASLIHFLF